MIKIKGKEINNEKAEVVVATSLYNKVPINVLDLYVTYKENEDEITNFFESFIKVEEIKKLKINESIEKIGTDDYIYAINGKMDDSIEDGTNFEDCRKQVKVKVKKINENKLKVKIEIEELRLECEEIVSLKEVKESELWKTN
ncbi:MAG: hypothetical protein IKF91_04295 [Bacilli bacterium]|nr:hypothetical protein [Bacilli bacterium]